MKPSELTAEDIAVFSRRIMEKVEFRSLPEEEKTECSMALSAAKAFAAGYAGLDMETVAFEDVTYAICVVAAEMLENRQMVAQYTGQNPTALQILDLHSTNLLPSVEA